MLINRTGADNTCYRNVPESHVTPNEMAGKADRQSTTLAARFWGKVDRKSDSECWLWTAAKRKDGYGAFTLGGKKLSAHRVSYALTKGRGRVPAAKLVRHKCDNPPCVNPAHLTLGTPKQNTRDSIRRGRHVNPVSPWMRRKLSSAQPVIEQGAPIRPRLMRRKEAA